MAKRSLARYRENDDLANLANSMRNARKLAGITQATFGKLIGISRESVVHIEGLYESSLLSLECEVLKRWYSACACKISEEERENLQNAINRYLFSSTFSLNIATHIDQPSENTSELTPNIQQQKVVL